MSETKKFLDYTGLVEVFKLVKSEDKKLQDAIDLINNRIGDWKWTTEDMNTIAAAVATLQSLIGEGGTVGQQITAALDKLDLDQVGGDGKYVKYIKQEDGQVTAESADLTASAVASTVAGLTGSNVQTLLEALLAKINADIDATKTELKGDASGEGDTLGKLEDRIENLEELVGEDSVEDQIKNALDELDLEEVGDGKKVITKISQVDGQVSAESAPITSSDKTITVDGLDLIVNIDGTTIVKGTDGKLGVASSALTQYVGKDAVKVSDVNTETNEKTISLEIAQNEKVLSQDGNGLKTTISLKKLATGSTDDVKEEYALVGIDGTTALGDTIKVYKDSSLKDVELDGQVLKFTYILADGSEKVQNVDISLFLTEEEYGEGLKVVDHKVSVRIDSTSEEFLTVSTNGVKLEGVQDAIDAATEALSGTDIQKAFDSVFNNQTTTPTDPTD